MSRTLNVVRMQFVNRQTYIWVPLIVLAGSFLLSLAVYAMIPVDAPKIGGGSQAPLWYFLVVGVYALTLSFPFSQAMSVTRRQYFLGTLLTAVVTSVGLAVIFIVGGIIEKATNGWGMNGWFFHLDWIWAGGPLAAGFFYFVIAMLFFIVGFCCATIYKRFGTLWLTVIFIALAAAVVGMMFIFGQTNSWGDVFAWMGSLTAVGLALWCALVAVVLAGVSYLILRRTVP